MQLVRKSPRIVPTRPALKLLPSQMMLRMRRNYILLIEQLTMLMCTYVSEFLLAQQPYSEGRRACQHWWAACGGEGCVGGDGLQEGVHLGLAEDLQPVVARQVEAHVHYLE